MPTSATDHVPPAPGLLGRGCGGNARIPPGSSHGSTGDATPHAEPAACSRNPVRRRPRDRMRAECSQRSHRLLAQRGRTDTTHRPALTNTDRSQPHAGTEHRQPDGRAEHGLAEPDAEQFVHLHQRVQLQPHLVVGRPRRPGPPRHNPAGYPLSGARPPLCHGGPVAFKSRRCLCEGRSPRQCSALGRTAGPVHRGGQRPPG